MSEPKRGNKDIYAIGWSDVGCPTEGYPVKNEGVHMGVGNQQVWGIKLKSPNREKRTFTRACGRGVSASKWGKKDIHTTITVWTLECVCTNKGPGCRSQDLRKMKRTSTYGDSPARGSKNLSRSSFQAERQLDVGVQAQAERGSMWEGQAGMTYWSSRAVIRATTREGTTAALGIWVPTGGLIK